MSIIWDEVETFKVMDKQKKVYEVTKFVGTLDDNATKEEKELLEEYPYEYEYEDGGDFISAGELDEGMVRLDENI